ncbi:Alanine--tRNA ligase [Melia azedarach]|uniref:Alanine--tRNA ligase n=2 Tax=Melia azedarach TaxID=155640 RepID=A0ACC1YF33_MELAZ|nr:Alanine--tRNA ligase [Melia azedarach]KAJ4721990.1 Alanine--tRNA ligase [Melia azedarach]
MKDCQTPQKEQSRQLDFANRRSKDSQLKKPQKVTKKSLSAAFRSVSEEFSREITNEPVEFSPIAEVSDAIFNGQIDESFALDPSPSAPPEPFNFSELTASSTVTVNRNELSDLSPDRHQFIKSNGSNTGSVEADVLAKLLKETRLQVLNSVDVDTKSKQLLDSLIKFVVDEFYTIPEENDRSAELVSMKRRIAFTWFLIWIPAALLFFFLNSGPQRFHIGALPT